MLLCKGCINCITMDITSIIIIIINLLFQTIVHMDIEKNIYKTHIINKLKIIRINGNQ